MNKKRPVNLDLRKVKFPITAIGSILHRITGVIIFLFIPLSLWALQVSLASPSGFKVVKIYASNPVISFFIWGFLTALIYHLFAGIRHLLMDIGLGETFKAARAANLIVFSLTIVSMILLGIWLW